MDKQSRFCSTAKLHPFRLINAVGILAHVAERFGIATEDMLCGSGICVQDLDDPFKRITLTQERIVARNLIEKSPIPWIGLEVGKDFNFSANGKLGMAMMCCNTLMEAFRLVLKYLPLTGSHHQYTITLDGDKGYARFKELTNLDGIREFCCESEVGSVHAMGKAGRDTSPSFYELHFAYPRPSYGNKYEELFQCPVFFDADVHMIVFDTVNLTHPLPLANSLVKRSLERDCDLMLPLVQEHTTVTERVHQELVNHGDAFPTLNQLARRINLSPRTLRRRLWEEQTSYKTIQSEIRKSRALDLLKTTTLTMENVALKLGFNDVSNFYRAFKTWTGCTPNTFRENARSKA
jgi:AraC-like DNA-binding protein